MAVTIFKRAKEGAVGTTFTMPSLTVPDASFTVRQLLDRFTTGNVPAIAREGYYENEDWDDYSPMNDHDFDLTDAQNLRDQLMKRAKQRQEEYEKVMAEKKKRNDARLAKLEKLEKQLEAWEKKKKGEEVPSDDGED